MWFLLDRLKLKKGVSRGYQGSVDPSIFIGPRVSMTMGTKICDWMISAYLALFRVAAVSAVPQSVTDVVGV